MLSSPVAGPAAWLAHAWCDATATLSLQPSRQLRVRIANKKRPLRLQRFFFAILTRGWPCSLACPCLVQWHCHSLSLQPSRRLRVRTAFPLLGLPDGVFPSCVPPGQDSNGKNTFVFLFCYPDLGPWLLACLPACLVACLLACLVAWLDGWVLGCLLACWLACPLACLPLLAPFGSG